MVVNYHDRGRKYAEDTIFKQSDWGVDAAEAMSYEYRELKTNYGCEMGDLMDQTPKGAMAKVMLEEKVKHPPDKIESGTVNANVLALCICVLNSSFFSSRFNYITVLQDLVRWTRYFDGRW